MGKSSAKARAKRIFRECVAETRARHTPEGKRMEQTYRRAITPQYRKNVRIGSGHYKDPFSWEILAHDSITGEHWPVTVTAIEYSSDTVRTSLVSTAGIPDGQVSRNDQTDRIARAKASRRYVESSTGTQGETKAFTQAVGRFLAKVPKKT